MMLVQTLRHEAGFSLVELMVVLLITVILLTIAVPTYQSQVRESRRTDAKTAVLDLAAREEKYASLNNSYTGSPANLGYQSASSTTPFPQTVGSGYYQVYACPGTTISTACTAGVAVTATASTYVIAAIPLAGTSQANDSPCQYFAVDNTGAQFSTNSTTGIGTDTTSTCWH